MFGSERVRVETVWGHPIEAGGRRFIPIARLVSGGDHRATVREKRVEGWGWGFVHIKPLAVIEEWNGHARTLPIPDETGMRVRNMAILSTVLAAVSILLILVHHIRRAGQPTFS